MKKRSRDSLLLSLLAALLVLGALGVVAARTALGKPAPAVPAPEAPTPSPTPHVHVFDADSFRCTLCGEICAHDAGFDEAHRCLACGYLCPHETHDPLTAVCPLCGKQFNHHFGMDGVCDVCGSSAVLYTARLPERYYADSAHRGRCLRETLTLPDSLQLDIAVYLPWDYDPEGRYNLLIMMHGDGGSCDDWTDVLERTERGDVCLRTVYDAVVEEHLCDPFLVVGIDNRYMQNSFYGEKLIEETLLPYLASHYATYMADGSIESIRDAREHIAIGGLSRGSIYTYDVAMARCLDVAANFCCFSNGYSGNILRFLRAYAQEGLGFVSYIATVGLQDEPVYVRAHRYDYGVLCSSVDTLRDGDNARLIEVDEGHNFLTWTASMYDALLLMF